MPRPLLSLVLMLFAVFGVAAAIGMATGWFDIGQIFADAVGQSVDAAVDWAVGGIKSFLSDVISSASPW